MGSTGNLSPGVFSVNVRAHQLSQVPSGVSVLGNRKFPLGTIRYGGTTHPYEPVNPSNGGQWH